MISYAQNYEDVILERALGSRYGGFYVDVGAGDPDHLSVTRWFYDQGWSGINIEPNRAFFQRLVQQRPRDVTLNIGASDAHGTIPFAETPVGELSTFDPTGARDGAIRREVEVAPLNDILAEYAGVRQIDFLKIDVEGWELPVLQGLDLTRFRPTILVIESVLPEGRTESHHAWEPLVTTHGYAMVYFDGLNRFYLADERADLADAFRLPPGVFDEITPARVVTLTYEMRLLTEAIGELAKWTKPPVQMVESTAVADVLNSISEIRQRLIATSSRHSRLILACEELVAALANRDPAAYIIPPMPELNRALGAIRTAMAALGSELAGTRD